MIVFGQSGCIRAKVIVILQSGCKWAKVILIGQKLLYSAEWFYSGKSGCIWAKVVLFGRCDCIRTKLF